ncbi:MAG: hypothetical protein HY675_18060 [Chloroflexi bacterium]|nr:hypothetical protein [Chloroflexota bacterium]
MRWNTSGSRILMRVLCPLLAALLLVGSQPLPQPARADDPLPRYPSQPGVAGPGWHIAEGNPVSPREARRLLQSQPTALSDHGVQATAAGLPSSEEEATTEIQSLARALQNDPRTIFDYVHNFVDYVPTFGSVNGATGTLLAGRGNDWDQTSLFIALMRAAGYTANYVVGDVTYGVSRLANWVGVDDDINVVANVFANGGVPVVGAAGGLQITRAWAEAVVGGQTYTFDPAMKEYTNVAGIDLATATGYSQTTFLQNAMDGATVTASYVQNANEANVRSTMATYSNNLVNYIRNQMPNASVGEVIGGRSIVRTDISSYPTSLPYALAVSNQATYASVPNGYRHTLRVQHAGIDQTFKTYEIASRRVSMFYQEADNFPILRVDGTPVVTGTATVTGTKYAMTATVDHPYAANGGTFAEQQGSMQLQSGSSYAIVHDFNGVSSDLAARRSRLLKRYRADGLADGSEPVLGEALWIMGLNWLYEVRLYRELVSRVGNVVSLRHHQLGVMGQERGYFIDIPMGVVSITSRDGSADTWSPFRAQGMMASAFEHGVLEQLQGSDRPSVSTIKLLQLSNAGNKKTFLADGGNWTSVQAELENYSASTLSSIQASIDAGHQVVLPKDAAITLNQWQGVGYVDDYQSGNSGSMGMIISGGYAGGYGTITNSLGVNRVVSYTETSTVPPDTRGELNTPRSEEPVDMATGAYVYDRTDLSMGRAEPLGLHFRRSYNSGRNRNLSSLGYGWTHNYDLTLNPGSDGGPGLGLRQPADAASLIAYAHVALDVLKNQRNIQGWVATALATKWAMDQILDNVVTVNAGPKSFEYVKLADGSYSPPPGVNRALVQEASGHSWRGRFDRRLNFDAQGRATSWTDADGHSLIFSYSGDKLQTVASQAGLTLTLAYTGNLMSSVSDQGGRTVRYAYDGDNLSTYRDAADNPWSYGYDTAHRLVTLTTPLAQTLVTNVYDGEGRVITQTDGVGQVWPFYFAGRRNVEQDPAGGRTAYIFDGYGRLASQRDALGKTARLVYDGQGHLVSATDRIGNASTFTYDGSHNLTRLTNALGNTTVITYDLQQRPTAIQDAAGNITRYQYDSKHHVTQYIVAGQTYTRTYNSQGLLATETNPTGGVRSYTYNADGTLASSTDSGTGVTTYTYDGFGRVTAITRPDGKGNQIGYDLNDRITSVTDGNGRTTTLAYNGNGYLVQTTDPAGQVVRYDYDALGRRIRVTDRLNKTSNTAYDSVGRVSSVTDPVGTATVLGYDLASRLTGVTRGASTWYAGHDDEGRVRSRTTPLAHRESYAANAVGSLIGITNPLSQTTTLSRDAVGRLTSFEDALSRRSDYTYDARGLLTSAAMPVVGAAAYQRNGLGALATIVDANGQQWTFTYSPMGRVQSQADPLGRVWQHSYDSRGWPSQTTFPDGENLTRTYDDAGNLTGIGYSGGTNLQYTYDALNRLVGASGIALSRDVEGRVIGSADAGKGFGATYDDAGRLKTATYDNGAFAVTYTYDAATGLLTRVADSLTGAQVDFAYDADFRLTTISRSNGVNGTLTWDNAARLTRIQEGSFLDLQYTLDAAGQVTQLDMSAPADPAAALTTGTATYTYDAAGQISSAGHSYDSRGRLVSSPGHAYAWDGASRLTQVDSTTLTYNGLGDVRTRSLGGATTRYHYNAALGLRPVVAEQDEGTGQFLRHYVWTPDGRQLYMIDAASGNSVYFFHFDRTGSTLALTNQSGSVTDAYAYTPFGRQLVHQGTSSQPFTFVGQYGVRQEGSGSSLYQMRARYYDAETGRFLSRDPLWPTVGDPRTVSPYQYAANDPIGGRDVTGLFFTDLSGLFDEQMLLLGLMQQSPDLAMLAVVVKPELMPAGLPFAELLDPQMMLLGLTQQNPELAMLAMLLNPGLMPAGLPFMDLLDPNLMLAGLAQQNPELAMLAILVRPELMPAGLPFAELLDPGMMLLALMQQNPQLAMLAILLKPELLSQAMAAAWTTEYQSSAQGQSQGK